jgi:hypothetical protein
MDPTALGTRLTAAGIPTLQGRTAALRRLVLQAALMGASGSVIRQDSRQAAGR